MQDIHPIRPPVEIGLDPAWFFWAAVILAGILAAAVLFILAKKLLKKKKETGLPPGLPRPLPPFEAAMKALDVLSVGGDRDARAAYFTLTLILRKYIGGSFGSHASEMTSQEFSRYISTLDMDPSVKTGISEFNAYSDPVKYAGLSPDPGRIQADLNKIRSLIEQIESGFKPAPETGGGQ